MDDALIARSILLVALLLLSAFFAGCEVALFSLSQVQLTRLREENGRAGAKISKLLDSPRRLLISIYIGNELVNVAASAVTTFIALELFGDAGLAIALGAGTFALLVVGEITPKTIAHYNNERWALLTVHILSFFIVIIHPAHLVVNYLSSKVVSLWGRPTASNSRLTEEELITLVEGVADEGVIDEGEKEMIQNVFEFGDVTVDDVMTPRTEIYALPIETPLKTAWDKLSDTLFSRAPVYEDSTDNVVGILYKKDLLRFDYPPDPKTKLASIVRKPFIVPETMPIDELLRAFKKKKTHVALAMDEYGGLTGLVTMNDVIEELVGETMTAREGDGYIEKTGPDSYRLSGGLELDRLNEKLNLEIKHDELETVGGYVFHLFGRVPTAGESIEYEGLVFTVEQVNERRIKLLTLRLKNSEHDNEAKG